MRCVPDSATMRSVPARCCSAKSAVAAIPAAIWPPITAVAIGAPPRNGAMTIGTFVAFDS